MRKLLILFFILVITPVFSQPLLTTEEIDGIKYIRESEKLSRDIYSTFYDTWELEVFNNLYLIEKTHSKAMKNTLIKYDIKDSIEEDTVGDFPSPYFQRLYDDFIKKGDKSFYEAIYIAATIEEMAIYDLKEYKAKIENKEISKLFLNLEYGSIGNLRKLNNELETFGMTYEARYITPAELRVILGK